MLKITKLVKAYAGLPNPVVKGIDITVAAGQFVTLLGPSGCGKTTTLRMIAGLEKPSTGEIAIDGNTVFSSATKTLVPANRRPIAMVFQSYAIWPHMDVFHNVSFPLESGKFHLSKAEIRQRTEAALAMVDLQDYAGREPSALSGGQQQRVALARALVMQPKILLLDEPLSNLDVRLRDQMRDTIKELHERTHLTTIFVTHDQNEAMALSNHIIVMNQGSVVEQGTPETVFQRPRHPFTAGFIGKYNILDGMIEGVDAQGLATIATGLGTFTARLDADASLRAGSPVHAYIRPGSLNLERAGPSGTGLVGRISSAVYQGSFWEMKVTATDDSRLLVHASLAAARRIDPGAGSDIRLIPDPDEVVVVRR
ncbi:MAG TPA: ABC transporter ATP-binding protein [Stellaceae bacterium]|jgi:ABC-type Fe3+/spermidine/putrescine transport system ATPase subunit|nr:ABC transporter ATP-binding protein [Stellaceae bacterium]